jgi:hypothetical protein
VPPTDRTADDGRLVELVDGEVMDADESQWAASPGEPPAGEPTDEVLRVHTLLAAEPPADDLDVPEDGLELPGAEEGEHDELLCSRCFLWKHRRQFSDVERRVCDDCA